MVIQKKLDIGWRGLLHAGIFCFFPFVRNPHKKLSHIWRSKRESLITLSVRSGFDLVLSVLKLPPGSEILISGVTVPDMERIARHHKLVIVPVPVNFKTGIPDLKDIQKKITGKTRVALIAQLFGALSPLKPIAGICRKNGILLLEDCAQAFHSLNHSGDPESDVSMFSFGTIKTATAFGCGVLFFKDSRLANECRNIMFRQPHQKRRTYLKKIIKYFVIKILSSKYIFSMVTCSLKLFSINYDMLIYSQFKGFPGKDLLPQIRKNPSAPLVRTLLNILENYDYTRIDKRIKWGCYLSKLLNKQFQIPCVSSKYKSYWVYTLMHVEAKSIVNKIRAKGYDASQRQGIRVISGKYPQDLKQNESLFEKMFYIPFDPDMKEKDFIELGALLLNMKH